MISKNIAENSMRFDFLYTKIWHLFRFEFFFLKMLVRRLWWTITELSYADFDPIQRFFHNSETFYWIEPL